MVDLKWRLRRKKTIEKVTRPKETGFVLVSSFCFAELLLKQRFSVEDLDHCSFWRIICMAVITVFQELGGYSQFPAVSVVTGNNHDCIVLWIEYDVYQLLGYDSELTLLFYMCILPLLSSNCSLYPCICSCVTKVKKLSHKCFGYFLLLD